MPGFVTVSVGTCGGQSIASAPSTEYRVPSTAAAVAAQPAVR